MDRPLYDVYREDGYWAAVIMLVIWIIAGEYF